MNFTWDMSESEYNRMMDEYRNKKDNSNNVYGQVFVGGVCCDFVNTMDTDDWYLYTNLFYINPNSGYGELPDGTKYDLYNGSPRIPLRCKTFASFKARFEKEFEKFIDEHEELGFLINTKTNWTT